VTTAVSEERGIRLLPDSGAVRAPNRAGTTPGRAIADGADHGQGPDHVASPIDEQAGVERPRLLRSDEAHPPRPVDPHGAGGRLRGPLSARVAQRQQRAMPGTIAIGSRSSEGRQRTAGDDRATGEASAL
jgi:hypothetical protein